MLRPGFEFWLLPSWELAKGDNGSTHLRRLSGGLNEAAYKQRFPVNAHFCHSTQGGGELAGQSVRLPRSVPREGAWACPEDWGSLPPAQGPF